jgi:hypothetical protein
MLVFFLFHVLTKLFYNFMNFRVILFDSFNIAFLIMPLSVNILCNQSHFLNFIVKFTDKTI